MKYSESVSIEMGENEVREVLAAYMNEKAKRNDIKAAHVRVTFRHYDNYHASLSGATAEVPLVTEDR